MTTEELPQLLDDGIHDRFAVDVRQFLDCELFMFHSVMVEHVLPGYGTVSLDRRSPTFRRVVPSSSRVDIYKHLKEKALRQRFAKCAAWIARDPRPLPRGFVDTFL